jgi:plastocyanin
MKKTFQTNSLLLISTLLCASSGALPAPADAVIQGRVTWPAKTASTCTAPASAARYQASSKTPAPTPAGKAAVVYLEGAFTDMPPQTLTAAQVEQKGLQFAPAILAIRKGTRVEFPNRDDEYHNVLSYSRVKEFDLGRYLKDEKAPSVVFGKAGVVELNCEIHEHMRAYILVLDTPHFTTTDAEGRFRLEHLPAGQYTLKAWLNPKTVWQKPVEIKEGATLTVDFVSPAQP